MYLHHCQDLKEVLFVIHLTSKSLKMQTQTSLAGKQNLRTTCLKGKLETLSWYDRCQIISSKDYSGFLYLQVTSFNQKFHA